MSRPEAADRSKVVPAQLGFFAIYNPSLGTTDETLKDQIVYYSDIDARRRVKRRTKADGKNATAEQINERLRQIGLAQGMVEFGKSFSDGKSIDSIETEKSRIVLHEVEAGWWMIASIDLTRLPSKQSKTPAVKGKPSAAADDDIEYSSREVKPSVLLLQDLLRAHSIFLLHHASSISALFVRNKRSKFVNILGRYWDEFLSTWNVMLHGNPAVAVYSGIKLAASGELGIGVGEEDRGSGEREVLEGFVGRIDGLVDIVVSKFGDVSENEKKSKSSWSQAEHTPVAPWLGTAQEPSMEDGAVFLGVGALSRKSLRDVTQWIEELYTWGPRAYGVIDNPTSTRQQHRKKRRPPPKQTDTEQTVVRVEPPTPEAPKTTPTPQKSAADIKRKKPLPKESDPMGPRESLGSLRSVTTSAPTSPELEHGPASVASAVSTNQSKRRPSFKRSPSSRSSIHEAGSKFMDYFKLGYGTHWSLGNSSSSKKHGGGETESIETASTGASPVAVPEFVPPRPIVRPVSDPQPSSQDSPDGGWGKPFYPADDSAGHYLVGLLGDIEQDEQESSGSDDSVASENSRLLVRTVTVELERETDARAEQDISIDLSSREVEVVSAYNGSSQHTASTGHASYDSQDRNKTKKLRVVVYVNKPFIFTMLFELRTEVLALPALYRSLHHQIAPLVRPLINSTLRPIPRPAMPDPSGSGGDTTPIYDLVWDPKTLTISSTIPSIPAPLPSHMAALDNLRPPVWTRMEALNTHAQILSTFASTRTEITERERTCKTGRGYWIVWTRIPEPDSPRQRPALLDTATDVSHDTIRPLPSGLSSRSPRSHAHNYGENRVPLSASAVMRLNNQPGNKQLATTGTSRRSGSTATSRSSAVGGRNPTKPETPGSGINSSQYGSTYSGPAHPFYESLSPAIKQYLLNDKEVVLVRKSGSDARSASGSFVRSVGIGMSKGGSADGGESEEGLARGIGVDVQEYVGKLVQRA